jgi:protein-S-isoprenylcysteine O-methyltransferase Ste14
MWPAARTCAALGFQLPARSRLALGFVLAGIAVAAAGIVVFRRARTTVNPLKPDTASALVASGIFRLTRNPMYLGGLFCLVGWAVFLANVAAFLLLPLFVLYLNRFQIAPEERALTARFGADFAAYCGKVRRWL